MEDRNKIWEDYFGRLSEMDKIIAIINYFVYLKDDELVNEFPLGTSLPNANLSA